MSAICLKCFNRLSNTNILEADAKFSRGHRFCDICHKPAPILAGWKRLTLFDLALRYREKPYTYLPM